MLNKYKHTHYLLSTITNTTYTITIIMLVHSPN